GRRRPLAAGLSHRHASRAPADPPEGDFVAMGLAGAGRHVDPRPGPRAGPALGVRVRARPRAVPPAAGQPFPGLLAGSRVTLSPLARRTGLVSRGRTPVEGEAAPAAAGELTPPADSVIHLMS